MAPQFKGKKITFHTPPQIKNLLDRERYEIPGTVEWLESKPDYVSPAFQTSSPARRVSDKKLRENHKIVTQIKKHIKAHGWEMIEGGEQHGKWINTAKYPKILFNPGKIIELDTGSSVLFPLSDGVEDPLGIAFHLRQCSHGRYTIETNEWYTLEDHTRRGRRRAAHRKKNYKKRKNRTSSKKNNTHLTATPHNHLETSVNISL
tara:strand:- start:311 stop:922 length:612 start_codon:yes stop_codon:yes gene_type:complete